MPFDFQQHRKIDNTPPESMAQLRGRQCLGRVFRRGRTTEEQVVAGIKTKMDVIIFSESSSEAVKIELFPPTIGGA